MFTSANIAISSRTNGKVSKKMPHFKPTRRAIIPLEQCFSNYPNSHILIPGFTSQDSHATCTTCDSPFELVTQTTYCPFNRKRPLIIGLDATGGKIK